MRKAFHELATTPYGVSYPPSVIEPLRVMLSLRVVQGPCAKAGGTNTAPAQITTSAPTSATLIQRDQCINLFYSLLVAEQQKCGSAHEHNRSGEPGDAHNRKRSHFQAERCDSRVVRGAWRYHRTQANGGFELRHACGTCLRRYGRGAARRCRWRARR